MHVLNRIIQRDAERVLARDGGWMYYTKQFVSCGCGWHGWFPNERDGEDAWIHHIETEIVRNADGDIVAVFPRR